MRISIGKAASTWLTVTLIGCSMLFETSTGWAQQKGPSLREQLMGTWTFVSASETRKDGTKMDRWGANPKGSLMFDASGRYIFVIMRGANRRASLHTERRQKGTAGAEQDAGADDQGDGKRDV